MIKREDMIAQISEKYFKFLSHIDFSDKLYVAGMQEARTKFVANCNIAYIKQHSPLNYRLGSNFFSEKAVEILEGNKNCTNLRYEHIVPKTRYIRDECEKLAKSGTLTYDFIYKILDKFLWTATVTTVEDMILTTTNGGTKGMPVDWDGVDIFARYKNADIKLVHNSLYEPYQDIIIP